MKIIKITKNQPVKELILRDKQKSWKEFEEKVEDK